MRGDIRYVKSNYSMVKVINVIEDKCIHGKKCAE